MDRVSHLRGQADVSADSTFDSTASPAYVTAEDNSKFFSLSEAESTDENVSSVSIADTSNKSCDDFKLDKQIKASPGGVDILDDTSCDGYDLVIDDKMPEDAEDTGEERDKSIAELIQEQSAVQREPEVILMIDGVNVNAIDIGNGIYLYRRVEDDSDELAAVKVEGTEPSFKFLKVRENAEGNLEVYEELFSDNVDYPEKEKSNCENTLNPPMTSEVATCSKMEVNKIPTPVKKEISTENELEIKTERLMKFGLESRKSPIIGSYTPMSFHSTPNKEGVPLTKTMVDLQLHTNKLPDTSTKTIELNSDKKNKETLIKREISPTRDTYLSENVIQDIKVTKTPAITIVSEVKDEIDATKDNNKDSIKEEDTSKSVWPSDKFIPDVPDVKPTNIVDISKIPQDLQNPIDALKDNVKGVNMDVVVNKIVTNEANKTVENNEIMTQNNNINIDSQSKGSNKIMKPDEISNKTENIKAPDDAVTTSGIEVVTKTSETPNKSVIAECSKEIDNVLEKDKIKETKDAYKSGKTLLESVKIETSNTTNLSEKDSSVSIDPKVTFKVETETQTKDIVEVATVKEDNAKSLDSSETIKAEGDEKKETVEANVQKKEKGVDPKSINAEESTVDGRVEKKEKEVDPKSINAKESTVDGRVEKKEKGVDPKSINAEESTVDGRVEKKEKGVDPKSINAEESTVDGRVEKKEKGVDPKSINAEESTVDGRVEKKEKEVDPKSINAKESTVDGRVEKKEKGVDPKSINAEEATVDGRVEKKEKGVDPKSINAEESTVDGRVEKKEKGVDPKSINAEESTVDGRVEKKEKGVDPKSINAEESTVDGRVEKKEKEVDPKSINAKESTVDGRVEKKEKGVDPKSINAEEATVDGRVEKKEKGVDPKSINAEESTVDGRVEKKEKGVDPKSINAEESTVDGRVEKKEKEVDPKSINAEESTVDGRVETTTVEPKTESIESIDVKVGIIAETKKSEPLKSSDIGESNLINNNIAVPFGKWTEANRQAFLNKIKETKVTHANSTTNQIKQPNDLNRRDVLKIIGSARQATNSKTTMPKRDLKIVSKPLKSEPVILPKKTQHSSPADIEPVVKTTSSELNNFKGDMSKRTEMVNQDLIDKTIEDMLTDKTLSLKHGQDVDLNKNSAVTEKMKEDATQKKCPPPKASMNKTPVSLLDDIEQKMNELHGPPQVERLQPSSRYNQTITSYSSNSEHRLPSTISSVLSYEDKLPQKTQLDVHPNEEDILECEPVTGDSTQNNTKTSSVDANAQIYINKERARSKEKTSIITERDFDKFARRNSVTCTDQIRVNFDSSQHNIVKTVVDSARTNYVSDNMPQPAPPSIYKSAFYPVYGRNSLFRHNYPNMSSVPPDEAVDKNYATSQFQVSYHTGHTDKRHVDVPALRIEDKPVKVVYLEGSNDFVPYNLNVQGQQLTSSNKQEPIINKKPEINSNKDQSHSNIRAPINKQQASGIKPPGPAKQLGPSNKQFGPSNKQENAEPEVTDPESTTGSCNSVDSDFMFGTENAKGSGAHRIKNTHKRKQILSTVNTSEIELIEPKDLMIETVKKKRKTEDMDKNKIGDNEKKPSKGLVPKKSYLLGRNEEQITASTRGKNIESSSSYDTEKPPIIDLQATNEYSQQDTPVNTLDSLVKAAELLEKQPDVVKSLVNIQRNDSENSQNPILKRGRGRPRKYPPAEGNLINKSPSPQKKAEPIQSPIRKSLSDHSETGNADGLIKENWTMGKINEKIVCPICNKLFRSEEVVYKHVQHCSGPSPNRSESSLSKGKRSLRSSRSDISYQDSVLDVKSTYKEGRNTEKHNDEVIVIECTPKKQRKPSYDLNNLKCEVCGKSFRQLSYFMKHKLLHEPKEQLSDVSLVCEICDKQFRKAHHLVQHRLIHGPRAQRKSTENSKSTSQQTNKTRLHCEDCDKSFRKLHHFVEHKQTHKFSNKLQNPPCCSICNKTFRKLHHLIEHKETHLDKTVKKNTLATIIHECPLCYMVFPNESSLDKHAIFCRRKRRVKRSAKHIEERSTRKSSDENEDEDIPVAHLKTNVKTVGVEELHEPSRIAPAFIPTNTKNDDKLSTKRKSEDSASREESVIASKQRKVEASEYNDVIINDSKKNNDTENKMGTAKNKDIMKDKNQVKSKDYAKSKDLAKSKELAKSKDLANDKNPRKSKDPAKSKDLANDKNPQKRKDHAKSKDLVNDKNPLKSKDPAKSKDLAKNKDSAKDKYLAKDKDLAKRKEKNPAKRNYSENKSEVAKLVVEDVKRLKETTTKKDSDKTDHPSDLVSKSRVAIESGETSEDEDVRYMLNPDYKTEFIRVSANKRNSLQIENPKRKDVKRRISLQHPLRVTRSPRISRSPRLKVKPAVARRARVAASSSDESDNVKYSFPEKRPKEPKKETLQRKLTVEKKPTATRLPKKRTCAEHRCDCGELFMSEALLSRHHTMAHTPPRIRRRRSPAANTKKQTVKPPLVAKSTRSKAK